MSMPSAEQAVSAVVAPLAALAIVGSTGVRVLLFMPISVSVTIMFLVIGMRKAAEQRRISELAGLRLITWETLSRMSHGKPFASVLRASLSHARSGNAARIVLGLALSRMEIGDTPASAMVRAVADPRCSGFSNALKDEIGRMAHAIHSGDAANALRSLDDELSRDASEASERRAGRMQRSAAVSILLGTIAPSFMTFGLVGYSIVSQQSIVIGGFAVLLVIAMPGLYGISTGWMDER